MTLTEFPSMHQREQSIRVIQPARRRPISGKQDKGKRLQTTQDRLLIIQPVPANMCIPKLFLLLEVQIQMPNSRLRKLI